MKTELRTWYNPPELDAHGWRFRIACCGFIVIADRSFDTKSDAEGFANHLIDKFLDKTKPEIAGTKSGLLGD